MGVDTVAKKVIKCDHCDGDPTCVKYCETKALQYVDATTAGKSKMREAAQKLSDLLRKTADTPSTA